MKLLQVISTNQGEPAYLAVVEHDDGTIELMPLTEYNRRMRLRA